MKICNITLMTVTFRKCKFEILSLCTKHPLHLVLAYSQGDHSPDNAKFPDGSWHSSAALSMLSVRVGKIMILKTIKKSDFFDLNRIFLI